MKPSVYVETTIPSYLTAWPSRDLVRAAHQQLTKEWWDRERSGFDVVVSQLVIDEWGEGDPIAAAERLAAIVDFPMLAITTTAADLSNELIAGVPFPPQAAADALHIAIATVHNVEYLLTWNCSHIANATFRLKVDAICRDRGFRVPVICTPEELLREKTNDNG